MIDPHHGWNQSFKPQCIGYVASLLLLFAVYHFVIYYELTGALLYYTVLGFAITQAIVQLFFFLHIGMESNPQWGLTTLLFTILVMIIIIGGSVWIMTNLNYEMMPRMKP
jgi:cytochrome o ubiquinol oxidase operon protein cyoD